MGKTKDAFGDMRNQTGSWQSCKHTNLNGVSSKQSTLSSNKLDPMITACLLLIPSVSSSSALWLHVYGCAFVNKYVCGHEYNLHVECICTQRVCVCVSDDSRLIKLLHSNELWLSVWQLLWEPLFTTSTPTHTHRKRQRNKRGHFSNTQKKHSHEKASKLTRALKHCCLCCSLITGKVTLMQERIIMMH